MIYTAEGFSKVAKHCCRNTSFVNASPYTTLPRPGQNDFSENCTGREIADWTLERTINFLEGGMSNYLLQIFFPSSSSCNINFCKQNTAMLIVLREN